MACPRAATSLTRRDMVATATGICAALLAACRAGGKEPAPTSNAPQQPAWDKEQTTVQFYIYLSETQLQTVDDKLLAPWRSEHPNVQIEVVAQPGATVEAIQKLTALLVAGSPPDVLWDLGIARNLAQQQLIQSIDDLVSRDRYDVTKFNQKTLDFKGRFEGKLHMLPVTYGGNAMGLLYNRQMFQGAGLPEPPDKWANTWTWAQWVDNLTRLTKTNSDGTVSQFGLGGYGYFIDWPHAYGGQWLSDDYRTVTCDSPDMIQCYADFIDLMYKAHVTPQPGEAQQLFGSGSLFLGGKVAITTMGGWEAGTYTGEPAQGIDWAFMPFPRVKIATPDMSTNGLALIKDAKHREAGWQFLKWLVQDSRLAKYQIRLPTIAADADAWARDVFRERPNARPQVLVEGIAAMTPEDNILNHPRWVQMNKDIVSPTWTAMQKGEKGVPEGLREMKPALQSAINAS
jgi:multiple sugar transport system substrate-binding protein